MSRGNGKMAIFLDDQDYREFIRLLRGVLEDYTIECWNYCLMPNHYHATLQPTLPNLSTAIQQLNGSYGQWWNVRHGKVGHVFQGRFKAQIVQRDGYAVHLSRYVALNPVRAKLVRHPEDWPWSSYAALIGQRPAPAFLSIDPTLALFGEGDRPTLQKRFARYVRAGYQDLEAEERIRSGERIIGDAAFKVAIRYKSSSG